MNIGIESETLEFKKTTGEVKAAMESIIAMLWCQLGRRSQLTTF